MGNEEKAPCEAMKTTKLNHMFNAAPRLAPLLLAAACITTPIHRAQAETLGELLEKGIYLEETKGSLEDALEVYLQVVDENRAGEEIAAHAQYRIGVCLFKQGDFEKASEAFEKVVSDYPKQTELVKLATEYLANAVSLLPSPWADGEEMQLVVKTMTGVEIGTMHLSIRSDVIDGEKIWRLNSGLSAGGNGTASMVEVDATSFKPIRSRWRNTVLGEANAEYAKGSATVTSTGTDEPVTTNFDNVYYDNEEVLQLIRRLPLGPDYKTTINVFSTLGGSTRIPIEAIVTGQETIEVPAGKFDCHKVLISPLNQTFWFSTNEHRYLVRFDAGGIQALLKGVKTLTPEELETQEKSIFDFPLANEK